MCGLAFSKEGRWERVFITCAMHYGWVCSCEQCLIGAEATSSLIKRVHGLIGTGRAGGGFSAETLPLCLQHPFSISLCPWWRTTWHKRGCQRSLSNTCCLVYEAVSGRLGLHSAGTLLWKGCQLSGIGANREQILIYPCNKHSELTNPSPLV